MDLHGLLTKTTNLPTTRAYGQCRDNPGPNFRPSLMPIPPQPIAPTLFNKRIYRSWATACLCLRHLLWKPVLCKVARYGYTIATETCVLILILDEYSSQLSGRRVPDKEIVDRSNPDTVIGATPEYLADRYMLSNPSPTLPSPHNPRRLGGKHVVVQNVG